MWRQGRLLSSLRPLSILPPIFGAAGTKIEEEGKCAAFYTSREIGGSVFEAVCEIFENFGESSGCSSRHRISVRDPSEAGGIFHAVRDRVDYRYDCQSSRAPA